MASRRRKRVATGSTNLPQLRQKPLRAKSKTGTRIKMRNVFPPKEKPVKPKRQEPAYPPLKNIHAVPTPVDYNKKLGFAKLDREQKCRTLGDLRSKIRRSRLPGLTSTDIDDDGIIDSTEIRLATKIREMGDNLSEAEKIRIGRKLLAKELIMDLDDMAFQRLGKQFKRLSKEEAVDMIANDPNFRETFNEYTIKKATALLMSSSGARATLEQMATARRRTEALHAENRAKHERNIWQASKSRAAELARNINTADRFRLATEGYTSLSGFNNHMARRKEVTLPRINRMKY